MSNTFDFMAAHLDMTRESLLEAIMDHVDCTVESDHFYKTDDASIVGETTGRLVMRSSSPEDTRVSLPSNVGVLELIDVEDEDGAPLPPVYVKLTFDIVELPVERND